MASCEHSPDYTYDLNGNRATRTDKATGAVVSYGWDAQDQLVSVSSTAGWSAVYRYDAQQRRIGKRVTAADGGVTEQSFVYDGPNVLFVFTTRDGVTTARRWLNAYGLDKRYGFEDYAGAAPTPGTGAVYEVHQDYRGSVIGVLDPVSGSLVSEYTYDSFGRRTVLREGVAPGYGFTGQQVDAETGLGYFRARYYDPELGRFLSEDPLGFPDGPMNAYAYVANAPYQSVDPFGLSAVSSISMHMRGSIDMANEQSALRGGITTQLALTTANLLMDAIDMFGPSVSEKSFPGFNTAGDRISDAKRGGQCHPIGDDGTRFQPKEDQSPNSHPPSGGPHDRAIESRRLFLLRLNAKHRNAALYFPITKNRTQRNMFERKVSTCRPDLQYNYSYVSRYLEEFFWSHATVLTINKMLVMNRADPFARQLGWDLGKRGRGR